MARTSACLLFAVLGLLPPCAARGADSPTAEQTRRAAEVRKKLATTINFNGIDDPDTKFSEALEFLQKTTDITFEINEQAFRDEMIDDPNNKPIGRSIPKMGGVSVEAALRRILSRFPTASGITFVVRGGVVEITTRQAASPSTWKEAPEVSLAFDKRELRDALQEIADATGVNVVLDARADNKGKTLVSATMRGVGVDTAVQLLANMAELTTMPVENVLYVTTRENAKALRAEVLKLDTAKDETTKPAKVEPGPKKDR
jgi:hypothetical protein